MTLSLTKVKGILRDITSATATSFPAWILVSVKHLSTCKEKGHGMFSSRWRGGLESLKDKEAGHSESEYGISRGVKSQAPVDETCRNIKGRSLAPTTGQLARNLAPWATLSFFLFRIPNNKFHPLPHSKQLSLFSLCLDNCQHPCPQDLLHLSGSLKLGSPGAELDTGICVRRIYEGGSLRET